MRFEPQATGEAKEALSLRLDTRGAATATLRADAAPRRLDLATHSALRRMVLQVLLAGSGLCSMWVAMQSAPALGSPISTEWQVWLALFPLMLLILPPRDDYRLTDRVLTEKLRHVGQVLNATGILCGLQAVLPFVGISPLPWSILVAVLFLHLALGAGLRVLVGKLARLSQPPLRIAVVGADAQGRALAHYLRTRSESIEVVGFIDDRSDRNDRDLMAVPFLGGTAQFASQPPGVDAVVIAKPDDATSQVRALAETVRHGRIKVYVAPAAPLLDAGHLHLARGEGSLQDMLLLGLQPLPITAGVAKRLFDIVFSATALLLLLPLGILIAALIKLESPGPVIFRQRRYGQGCRLFDLYKFRSMRFDPATAPGEIRLTERSDARVTRIGDFLRRTSLDELPQFMNVLLGQMSVVGPRPHPPGVKAGGRTYEEVVADFLDRYAVRPGITGWAQVNGLRGNTFTEDHLTRRFASDVEYIRNWSFELDLWIVLKTVLGGFRGKNAF